jgi:hypothetical protein
VNRSGRCGLKEGAVVAVIEQSPREEKTEHRRRKHSPRKRRNDDAQIGGSNVTYLINELPGNSSLNTVHYATVEKAVFSAVARAVTSATVP